MANQDGIRAWHKMYKHYHRRTFAKADRDHWKILYPRPLRLGSEVVAAVMGQEGKVITVDKAYEEILEMLKVAALIERMPPEIKDMYGLHNHRGDEPGRRKVEAEDIRMDGQQGIGPGVPGADGHWASKLRSSARRELVLRRGGRGHRRQRDVLSVRQMVSRGERVPTRRKEIKEKGEHEKV